MKAGENPVVRPLTWSTLTFNVEIDFTLILFGIPESQMPYVQNTNGIIFLKSFFLYFHLN